MDNLTIQIAADSSKLRADLLVAQAELRKFTSDVNKNVRAGDTAGAAASAASGALAAEKAMALKTALAGSNIEAAALTSRLRDGARELEHIRGQFRGGFEGLLGNAAGGLSGKALGIGVGLAALGELGKLVGETAERAHKMEAFSEVMGISTGEVREWMKAAGAAGVDADVFAKNLERLAANAQKAAEEQRKLRIETAQLIAKDTSFGVVARGGMSTPPPAPTGRFADAGLFTKDDDDFRRFAAAQRKIEEQGQEVFRRAGQQPPPLPDENIFAFNLRKRMAQMNEEGRKLRDAAAKEGVNAPVASMQEALGRLSPGFQDAFSKNNITLIDETTGKMRDLRDTIKDIAIGFSEMDRAAKIAFAKTEIGRGGIEPRFMESFSKMGEQAKAGQGPLTTPPAADKNVAALSDLGKSFLATTAAVADFGITVGGTIVRGVEALIKPEGDAAALAKDLGDNLKQIAIGPEASVLQGDLSQIRDQLREVRDMARSAAAAVGAALSGGATGADQGEPIPGFAQGGLFSGRPGRDTNLAWMTDGEYVINRDSARRIGLSTLNAMNFGRHLPRYASGGAVGSIASGGSLGTVHLTLDGQTHSLRADRQNFEGIVQYARTRRLAQIAPRPANAT